MALRKYSKKQAHQVYRLADGRVVPGGSTICKLGESSGHLIDWANKQGLEGLDCNKVRDESAHIGTVGHGLIECHFVGDSADFSEFSQIEINKGQDLFDQFLQVWEEQGLEWIASEQQLVSEEHKYGGTLDIIARKSGKLTLADVKSSPNIYGSFYRQLAGYENLWNENNEEKIERRVIIRLDKKDPRDTDVRWLGDMTKHFKVFLAQLNLYYALKAL